MIVRSSDCGYIVLLGGSEEEDATRQNYINSRHPERLAVGLTIVNVYVLDLLLVVWVFGSSSNDYTGHIGDQHQRDRHMIITATIIATYTATIISCI